MFHRLGQGQRPHEVGKIVGQGMQLKTYLVVAEAVARKLRPVDRVLALLDVLLRCAPAVVELRHLLGGPRHFGYDEPHTRK